MENVTNVADGAGDVSGSAQTDFSGTKSDVINPAKRAQDAILGELKQERAKRRELEEKMQAIEADKLLEQGKLKEYAESFKSRAEKLEQELKMTKQNFAFSTLKAQVERKASELGCLDSDLLIKTIDVDRLQVDESFNVDIQSLTEVLENVRKSKPFLFKQDGPKFRDAEPKTSAPIGAQTIKKGMTLAEAKEYAAKIGLR